MWISSRGQVTIPVEIRRKAFIRYRQAGGVRRSPLPEFYIGAHALGAGMTLLTRDGSC